MLTRTARCGILVLLLVVNAHFSSAQQDEIVDVIDQAKEAYVERDYQQAASQLQKAWQMVNQLLTEELKTFFPEPTKGWRADSPTSAVTGMTFLVGFNARRSYYRKGGGSSVDIEFISNASKISTYRMWLVNPTLMSQTSARTRISTVAGFRCIEKYDAIDRYAELNFLPGSNLLVTLKGYDMKDTKELQKLADKIDWNGLQQRFP